MLDGLRLGSRFLEITGTANYISSSGTIKILKMDIITIIIIIKIIFIIWCILT